MAPCGWRGRALLLCAALSAASPASATAGLQHLNQLLGSLTFKLPSQTLHIHPLIDKHATDCGAPSCVRVGV